MIAFRADSGGRANGLRKFSRLALDKSVDVRQCILRTMSGSIPPWLSGIVLLLLNEVRKIAAVGVLRFRRDGRQFPLAALTRVRWKPCETGHRGGASPQSSQVCGMPVSQARVPDVDYIHLM